MPPPSFAEKNSRNYSGVFLPFQGSPLFGKNPTGKGKYFYTSFVSTNKHDTSQM